MKSLTVLADGAGDLIQEPFLSQFIETYWDRIALAIPVTDRDISDPYFDVINQGHMVDWLFAIMSNPLHPLDVDWVCLHPRQAHPWGYGDHPATSNFNGGGSTACLYETLALIEALAVDGRVSQHCRYFPELYLEEPPDTFSYYGTEIFSNAQILTRSDFKPFKEVFSNIDPKKFYKPVCLGLYGCSDDLLNMKWQVESLHRGGSWTLTTMDLADKVTLALRLSGKSDQHTDIVPASAFGQWNRYRDPDHLEPLLIRITTEVLLCTPESVYPGVCDAHFLDCNQQKLERFGSNGESATPILREWGVSPKDSRLEFLHY